MTPQVRGSVRGSVRVPLPRHRPGLLGRSPRARLRGQPGAPRLGEDQPPDGARRADHVCARCSLLRRLGALRVGERQGACGARCGGCRGPCLPGRQGVRTAVSTCAHVHQQALSRPAPHGATDLPKAKRPHARCARPISPHGLRVARSRHTPTTQAGK